MAASLTEKLKEKLKQIKEDLKTPPKLSTVEVDKITATFVAMKGILDDTLQIVLEKDRAEAFRYTNLIVESIQQADVKFIGGVAATIENDPEEDPDKSLLHPELGPVAKPDFKALLEALTPEQTNVAMRLDCVKQYEEVGDAIVCADCSPERMIACIRVEDPSIDPNKDFELDVKMMRNQGNNP